MGSEAALVYVQANSEDYSGIMSLQSNNFITHLSDEDKKQGFLSVEFTQEQFHTMNAEAGVIVCKQQNQVVGYLCTSTIDFNRAFILPAAMLALCPALYYQGKHLDQYYSFIVGPWCIDKSYRGQGVFLKLWQALYSILPDTLEMMMTFISVENTHSLHAAKKAGMEVLTDFEHNDNTFSILVMPQSNWKKENEC